MEKRSTLFQIKKHPIWRYAKSGERQKKPHGAGDRICPLRKRFANNPNFVCEALRGATAIIAPTISDARCSTSASPKRTLHLLTISKSGRKKSLPFFFWGALCTNHSQGLLRRKSPDSSPRQQTAPSLALMERPSFREFVVDHELFRHLLHKAPLTSYLLTGDDPILGVSL